MATILFWNDQLSYGFVSYNDKKEVLIKKPDISIPFSYIYYNSIDGTSDINHIQTHDIITTTSISNFIKSYTFSNVPHEESFSYMDGNGIYIGDITYPIDIPGLTLISKDVVLPLSNNNTYILDDETNLFIEVFGISSNGSFIVYPYEKNCKILFTNKDKIPLALHMTYDFNLNEWIDKRDVNKVKEDLINSLRIKHKNKYDIEWDNLFIQFEAVSNIIIYNEVCNELNNTPYIDMIVSNIGDITRDEFIKTTKDNLDNTLEYSAKIYAQMFKMKRMIDSCNTIKEINGALKDLNLPPL